MGAKKMQMFWLSYWEAFFFKLSIGRISSSIEHCIGLLDGFCKDMIFLLMI